MHLPTELSAEVTKPHSVQVTEVLVNLEQQTQEFDVALDMPASLSGLNTSSVRVFPRTGNVNQLNQVPITVVFNSTGVDARTHTIYLNITTRYLVTATYDANGAASFSPTPAPYWRKTEVRVPFKVKVNSVAALSTTITEVGESPILGDSYNHIRVIPVSKRAQSPLPTHPHKVCRVWLDALHLLQHDSDGFRIRDDTMEDLTMKLYSATNDTTAARRRLTPAAQANCEVGWRAADQLYGFECQMPSTTHAGKWKYDITLRDVRGSNVMSACAFSQCSCAFITCRILSNRDRSLLVAPRTTTRTLLKGASLVWQVSTVRSPARCSRASGSSEDTGDQDRCQPQ